MAKAKVSVDVRIHHQSSSGEVGEVIPLVNGKVIYPREGEKVFLVLENYEGEPVTAEVRWEKASAETIEVSPKGLWSSPSPVGIGPEGPKSVTVTFFGKPRWPKKRGQQTSQTTIPFMSRRQSLA